MKGRQLFAACGLAFATNAKPQAANTKAKIGLLSMPRFVILDHDHPPRHWDFMLQRGDVLRTWRLAAPPAPGQTVPAEAIGDHRLAYLDYEGPVGGERGTVMAWDRGTYVDEGEASAERVVVRLSGTRYSGRVVLAQTANGWMVMFE
jgi:hypothetical protein